MTRISISATDYATIRRIANMMTPDEEAKLVGRMPCQQCGGAIPLLAVDRKTLSLGHHDCEVTHG